MPRDASLMTRDELIQNAVTAMSSSPAGAQLAVLLRVNIPALQPGAVSTSATSVDLMTETTALMKTIRAELNRLGAELKAIDS